MAPGVRADSALREGDSIELRLSGVPATEMSSVSGLYTIDGEGNINLAYVGRTKIAGLTSALTQSAIESAFRSRGIYTNPNVVITVQAQSRFVNVGGQVKLPQRVPYTADLTVLDALNAAGGISAYGNERQVKLLRRNEVTIIDVRKIRTNSSLDVPVQPEDSIEVPSIFSGQKGLEPLERRSK